MLETPVKFECQLCRLIQLTGASGVAVSSWLVLGEIVSVYIDPALSKDGVYQSAEAHPILRAGRMGDYAEITPAAMFEMPWLG